MPFVFARFCLQWWTSWRIGIFKNGSKRDVETSSQSSSRNYDRHHATCSTFTVKQVCKTISQSPFYLERSGYGRWFHAFQFTCVWDGFLQSLELVARHREPNSFCCAVWISFRTSVGSIHGTNKPQRWRTRTRTARWRDANGTCNRTAELQIWGKS